MHSKIIIRRMHATEKATSEQVNRPTFQVKQRQYMLEMATALREKELGYKAISLTTPHADTELIRYVKNQHTQVCHQGNGGSTSPNASSSGSPSCSNDTHKDKWGRHYQDLIRFRKVYGHCLVPHLWSENKGLALWVKRQRYQYKLKKDGLRTTMTDSRQEALEEIGFIWEPHDARWEERLNDLLTYKKVFGTCNVRSTCTYSPRLADWVKSQRRQYRNFVKGQPSRLTKERIEKLDTLGFIWNPRDLDLRPKESK